MPLKADNSVGFLGIVTRLCKHQYYLMAKHSHPFKFLLDSSSPGMCSSVKSTLPSQAGGEMGPETPLGREGPGTGERGGRPSLTPM